jgi:hypothetical protein
MFQIQLRPNFFLKLLQFCRLTIQIHISQIGTKCHATLWPVLYLLRMKVGDTVQYPSTKSFTYHMFVLSSSDRRLYEFTTYLGPLKKLLPKFLTKVVCQKQPKSVQPAQPTGQCSQETNFKKTYCII